MRGERREDGAEHPDCDGGLKKQPRDSLGLLDGQRPGGRATVTHSTCLPTFSECGSY